MTIDSAGGTTTIDDILSVSGNATFNSDLSVTNNVSIGGTLTVTGDGGIAGTLTYEDVSRVDAVGLSTFREGIFLPDNQKAQFGNAAGSAD